MRIYLKGLVTFSPVLITLVLGCAKLADESSSEGSLDHNGLSVAAMASPKPSSYPTSTPSASSSPRPYLGENGGGGPKRMASMLSEPYNGQGTAQLYEEQEDSVRLGDVNGDGLVDERDSRALIAHLNGDQNAPVYIQNADINGDGILNSEDLQRLLGLIYENQ